MSSRFVCLTIIVAVALSLAAFAQTPASGQAGSSASKPVQIKTTTAPYTDPTSGKDMYNAYCASCHGTDGKGDGPAAPALKVPPTNLTELAAKNKGEYPSAAVAQIVRGDTVLAAHGGKDMPIWGPVFMSLAHRNQAEELQRIRNLNNYIKGMQQK